MKIGSGARPMGMGKAFVAVSNDGNSPFINPAGLSELKKWQITSMYVNLLEGDLPYTLLSGTMPFRGGNVGIGLIYTGVSNIPSPTSEGIAYFDYYDRLMFLSYGVEAGVIKNLSWGTNFKIYNKGFSGSETNAGSGIDLDFGIKYKLKEWLSVGANLQNLLPTRLVWKTGAQDSMPLVAKFGVAARFLNNKLSLSTDIDFSPTRRIPSPFHFGVEYILNNYFTLRGGVDQTISGSSYLANNPTLGLTLNLVNFNFDYAYHPYVDISSGISHYFSFGYSPVKEEKPVPKPVRVKVNMKTFSDVPIGYWAKNEIEELATLGIITGYPDGTFKPEGTITRAELTTMLLKTRGIEKIVEKPTYTDVEVEHWASKYIEGATEAKIVTGYPDGTFMPKSNISRAEGVIIITRFANLPLDKVSLVSMESSSFYNDLSDTHWAYDYIVAAQKAGYLGFVEHNKIENNFEPNKELTRAESAWIISRIKEIKDRIDILLNGK